MCITMRIGLDHGRRKRLDRCATWRTFVSPTATKCQYCGGTMAGDITSPNDRLDAEEKIDAEDRGS